METIPDGATAAATAGRAPGPRTEPVEPGTVELQALVTGVEQSPLPALLVDDGERILACNQGLWDLLGVPGLEPAETTLYRLGLRLLDPEGGGAGGPGAILLLGRLPGGTQLRLEGGCRSVRVAGVPGALRFVVLAPAAGAPRQDTDDMLHLLVFAAQEHAIFTLDPDGLVASWNPGAQRIKGYRAEEILGRHFSIFYPAEDVARGHPRRELAVAAQTGRYTEEGWRVRKDGSRFWAHVTIIALRDPGGGLRGFGKVTQDVSERRSAEQALQAGEERFRELAESLTSAYVLADGEPGPDGRHRWVARYAGGAFFQIFGLDPAELVAGRASVLDVVHPEDVERVRANWSEPDLGAQELQFRVVRRYGGRRWVRARYRWLPGGDGRRRVACVLEDVTQERLAEEELRNARAVAEHASQAKTGFLTRMSHELRTPLNAVLGFAQLIELEDAGEAVAECVAHIRRSGEHLLDLINEVLDIARIESGDLALSAEDFDAGELAREVADLMTPVAEESGVTLSLDQPRPMWVVADARRVRQILFNLLSNAVKYNRAGGSVLVRCHPSADGAELRVRDNGIGIAPEYLPRLFQPFDRLGAEHTGVAGTGVGLALSWRLARSMGGRLSATSEHGVGSTFALRLPVGAPRAAEPLAGPRARPPAGAAPDPAARSLRLVYVEDDRANTELIQAAVGRRPRWTLTCCPSGGAAVDVISALPPDLVLLDLNLPDIDGEEVLARLRAGPAAAVPAVVMSSDATAGRKERLTAAGVRAYLTKPMPLSDLLTVLDRRAAELDGQDPAR